MACLQPVSREFSLNRSENRKTVSLKVFGRCPPRQNLYFGIKDMVQFGPYTTTVHPMAKKEKKNGQRRSRTV